MSDIILGILIDGPAERDAIHIAIAPVTCDEMLHPGQRVSLVEGTSDKVEASTKNVVGIVDPYLRAPVPPGRRFWLCLFCKTVTSLSHHWTHPAFKEDEFLNSKKKTESINFIDEVAMNLGISHVELMLAARQWVARGDYYHMGDNSRASVPPEFWHHYEIVTGQTLDEDKKVESFFSCSC